MSFDPNSNSILTDPEYLLQNPGYIKQAHDLLVQYGIIPTSGFGADAATAQEVNANPYSTAALLKKGYATNLGNNANQANAAGALFSGAYQNNNLHSADTYQQGLSGAAQQLQSGLNTVSGNRTNTLVDIWKRLSTAQSAVAPDTTVYTPPQPAAVTATPASGLATPQGPYNRTGPETYDKYAPLKTSSILKKGLTGITGGQGLGHVT